MLRLKKVLLVAGLLSAGLFAASSAQAGGYGHYGFYHHYTPVYKVYTYHYVPAYNYHCYPSYGFGY